MSEPLLILRGSKGLYLINGNKPYNEYKSISDTNTIRSIDVSNDGKYLAFADSNCVKVLTLPNCETIFEKIGLNVNFVKLSPKANVLTTWHHFTDTNPLNLNFYSVFNQTFLNGLSQKKPSRWCPQWTQDESVSVRHVNMELNFYENNQFERFIHRMCSQKVSNFSMITNRQTGCHYIACYSVGVKGQPSFVRIYQYPRFDGIAIANKSFYKADYVDFKWSPKGDALLLTCATDVDSSGKSYYGQQTLHYLDISGQTFIVKLSKDGPIHSISWVPTNDNLFCVIYGFMPAKTSLFNNKAENVFDFGEEMRNIISFNRFGNLLALSGFGNLSGSIQVWDLKQKKLISQFKASDTTLIEWCPDGKRILTATTSPRLRVGNGFRIWTYEGNVEYESIKYDSSIELNEILWQPYFQFTEPVVQVSKGMTVNKPSEPVKYVPPQMRKSNDNSNANKAKTTPKTNPNPLSESEKKSKNLKKKLEQIDKLKQLMASGKQLEKNQLEKVSKEEEILDELRELQLNC